MQFYSKELSRVVQTVGHPVRIIKTKIYKSKIFGNFINLEYLSLFFHNDPCDTLKVRMHDQQGNIRKIKQLISYIVYWLYRIHVK